MEAIREILSPQSEDLVIKVPRKFIKKRLEVLIFPFEQTEEEKPGKKERLMKIYAESKGILPVNYKFNREEAHER